MENKVTLIVYIMLVTMMIQLLPMQVFANSTNTNDELSGEEEMTESEVISDEKWLEVIDEGEETISLYEDILGESDNELTSIIYEIPNDSSIEMIEEFDEYSLIQFIDYQSDEGVQWTGYVYNNYIQSAEEDKDASLEEDNDELLNEQSEMTQDEQELEGDEIIDSNDGELDLTESSSDESNSDNDEVISSTDESNSDNDEIISSTDESNSDSDEVISSSEGMEDSNLNDENENEEESETFSAANVVDQIRYEGIALKDQTAVYKEDSLTSNPIKKYDQGQKLIYESYNDNWYEAKVYLEGSLHTGYINKNDVENIVEDQTSLKGIGLQDLTNVYQHASTNSEILRGYSQGDVLIYKTLTSEWYGATIYLNGKAHTGYIKKSDVENVTDSQVDLKGIALEGSAKVYSKASQGSKVLKSYSQGNVLFYKTFTSDWYEATVYIGGKPTAGYIHKSDVQNGEQNQKSLSGVGIESPTRVYTSASKDSVALRSYNQGDILKYRTFVSNWYEATVYVDGKKTTGYIYESDVQNGDENQESLKGIGLDNPTRVYKSASKDSVALRSYNQGDILKYKTFVPDWYEATVYIDGQETKGYIHTTAVETSNSAQTRLDGFAKSSPTTVYESASKNSKELKSYSQWSSLKFRLFTENWYGVTIYLNGERTTGYIHKDDVSIERTIKETIDYSYTLDEAIEIQMSLGTPPQTDKYRNDPAYVHGAYLDVYKIGKTTGTSNIRTEPVIESGTIHTKFTGDTQVLIEATVKGDTYADSDEWYQIHYEGASLFVHTSQVDESGSLIGIANATVNVRQYSNTQSHIFGRLTKGNKVTVTNKGEWHQINYKQWRNAEEIDVEFYLNPENNDLFQHLKLDSSVDVSEEQINRFLVGKGVLEGLGKAFIDAANTHAINEMYLISHAFLETGHGKSELANGVKVGKNDKGLLELVTASNKDKLINIETTYNMFGIAAYDNDALRQGAFKAYYEGWFTPTKSIIGGAKFIGERYIHNSYEQNTLYKMRWSPNRPGYRQYATDMAWAAKQVYNFKSMYELLDDPIYHFELPNYLE